MKKRTKKVAVSAAAAFGAKLAFDLKDPVSMGNAPGEAPALSTSKPAQTGGLQPRTGLASGPDPRMNTPKPLGAQPSYTTESKPIKGPLDVPAMPGPLPIDVELKLRQRAIDHEQASLRDRERADYGDYWAGKNQSPTGRAFGESVVYPTLNRAADLSNRVIATGENVAARGAGLGMAINSGIGQWGKWLTTPWNKPQPLSSAEQRDYKALQTVLSGGDRTLTPEELTRATSYDKRQRAWEAERERQDSWDAYSTRSVNDRDRTGKAVEETSARIEDWSRPAAANYPRAKIVTAPNGQQVVVTQNEGAIDQLQRELSDAAGDSTLGRIGNTSYGVGNAAMDQVPTALATAGTGTVMSGLGKVMPYGRSFFTTGGQLLNPSMGQLFPNTTARIGAGVGAGVGVYAASDDIANAQTRDEQVAAGQGLLGNVEGGAFIGGTIGAMAPGAARLYERTMYPSTVVRPPAVPVPPVAPVAAQAATRPSTLGTYGAMAGGAVAGGVIDGARANEQARNDYVAQKVQPAGQIIEDQAAQLQAGDPTGLGELDVDRIPPEFYADASRANAGEGLGLIGSNELLRPGETEDDFKLVPTVEDGEFHRWMQSPGVFKTEDGQPGAIEQQALQAGQAAFDKTVAETGQRADADVARKMAYRTTYEQSFRDDQRAQYDKSREELEKTLGTPDFDPDAANGQFEKTLTHLIRSNPDEAKDAKEFISWAEQKANGNEEPNPKAQAFEEKSRDTFLAQAAAASPSPAGAQSDPQAYGAQQRGLLESFNEMPTEAKAAIGIGLPLALVGMMMSAGDEEGGFGGMLLGLLGMGIAGIGAAGGGMFGDGAQQMVGGGMRSVANMFGAKLPEGDQDLSLLTKADPVGEVLSGAGKGGFNVAGIQSKLEQAKQLRQLAGLPRFIAVPLMRSLDSKNIRTAQQAEQAYVNAQRLVTAMDDPNNPLSAMMRAGQDVVNSKDKVDGLFSAGSAALGSLGNLISGGG